MDMNFLQKPNTQQPISKQQPARSSFKTALISIVVLLLLGTAGAAGYFYYQLNVIKKTQNLTAQDQAKALVAQISKIILLPTGEDPTIATVSDLSALKDQPFFANAKVGDKVLVYDKAKTAYLYDPVTNKIINVGPVSNPTTPQTSGANTTPETQMQPTQTQK